MVTRENYFSPENQMKYWGSSQLKTFLDCEAAGVAELKGEYQREKTVSLYVGSYIDAHFEGTLDIFQAQNPQIFTRNGDLRSEYKQANEIISRLERDPMFMQYMSGEKQVIKTGKLFGKDWKVRIDSYHPGKAIVDLKVMKDFEPVWTEDRGKLHFIGAWRYDIQAAIYQAIEGNNLPFIIAAATKQRDATDLELYRIPQHVMDSALKVIEHYIDRFDDVKHGKLEPVRCGKCPYCRQTKVLKEIVEYEGSEEE
jgi:hypothetical protein